MGTKSMRKSFQLVLFAFSINISHWGSHIGKVLKSDTKRLFETLRKQVFGIQYVFCWCTITVKLRVLDTSIFVSVNSHVVPCVYCMMKRNHYVRKLDVYLSEKNKPWQPHSLAFHSYNEQEKQSVHWKSLLQGFGLRETLLFFYRIYSGTFL